MSVSHTSVNSSSTSRSIYRGVKFRFPSADKKKKNATLALRTAVAVARAFDANCKLRNPVREATIPMFESNELVLGSRSVLLSNHGYFSDIHLRGINLTDRPIHGDFGEEEELFRMRFADRAIDGYYAVRFLRRSVHDSIHAVYAASDIMMETKILMNLAPHPNICQIYGVTAAGSDAFLMDGKDGFFIIVDGYQETLIHRLELWRREHTVKKKKPPAPQSTAYNNFMERLEVALDVASALLFLSSHKLVLNIRPEKVAFDMRYGRVKLCCFGQAREDGQIDQAPSLVRTDDINTLAYTAPELFCEGPVTVQADVHAFGVMLWEMLTLHQPFEGMTRGDFFELVVMDGMRPSMSLAKKTWPREIEKLVDECWDPHMRPTMKKVCETIENTLLFQDDPALPPLEAMTINDDEKSKYSQPAPSPKSHSRKKSEKSEKSERSEKPSLSRRKSSATVVTGVDQEKDNHKSSRRKKLKRANTKEFPKTDKDKRVPPTRALSSLVVTPQEVQQRKKRLLRRTNSTVDNDGKQQNAKSSDKKDAKSSDKKEGRPRKDSSDETSKGAASLPVFSDERDKSPSSKGRRASENMKSVEEIPNFFQQEAEFPQIKHLQQLHQKQKRLQIQHKNSVEQEEGSFHGYLGGFSSFVSGMTIEGTNISNTVMESDEENEETDQAENAKKSKEQKKEEAFDPFHSTHHSPLDLAVPPILKREKQAQYPADYILPMEELKASMHNSFSDYQDVVEAPKRKKEISPFETDPVVPKLRAKKLSQTTFLTKDRTKN